MNSDLDGPKKLNLANLKGTKRDSRTKNLNIKCTTKLSFKSPKEEPKCH